MRRGIKGFLRHFGRHWLRGLLVCRPFGCHWQPDAFYQKEDTINMRFRCHRCGGSYEMSFCLNVDFALNRSLKAITSAIREQRPGKSGVA